MTYEYACAACGHQWEAEQSIKDAPLKTCASCGENTAKRLVSGGTGFLLKGGGWYADLYSSSKPSSAGSNDGSKPSSTTSPSGSSPSTGESKGGGDSPAASSTDSKPKASPVVSP